MIFFLKINEILLNIRQGVKKRWPIINQQKNVQSKAWKEDLETDPLKLPSRILKKRSVLLLKTKMKIKQPYCAILSPRFIRLLKRELFIRRLLPGKFQGLPNWSTCKTLFV